jgi:hypothetical protein
LLRYNFHFFVTLRYTIFSIRCAFCVTTRFYYKSLIFWKFEDIFHYFCWWYLGKMQNFKGDQTNYTFGKFRKIASCYPSTEIKVVSIVIFIKKITNPWSFSIYDFIFLSCHVWTNHKQCKTVLFKPLKNVKASLDWDYFLNKYVKEFFLKTQIATTFPITNHIMFMTVKNMCMKHEYD